MRTGLFDALEEVFPSLFIAELVVQDRTGCVDVGVPTPPYGAGIIFFLRQLRLPPTPVWLML